MIKDDGDIIRGLGFVALYSSYLEEQIDNLLLSLSPVISVTERELSWQVSRKIKYIKKGIKILEFESKDDLLNNLSLCKEIFEDRNELIHGRIYSNFGRSTELRSRKTNKPHREVNSNELYSLANQSNDFCSVIMRSVMFEIPKVIKNKNINSV